MAFKDLYALSTEGSTWSVKQDYDTVFNWDYDDGRAAMMGLYAKGKEMQWDAVTRIDWSQELDEGNPEGMPDESMPIHMAACFQKMSEKEKGEVRRHFQAWQLSQFMQGEQGALICAAKIVTQVPDVATPRFHAQAILQRLQLAQHESVPSDPDRGEQGGIHRLHAALHGHNALGIRLPSGLPGGCVAL